MASYANRKYMSFLTLTGFTLSLVWSQVSTLTLAYADDAIDGSSSSSLSESALPDTSSSDTSSSEASETIEPLALEESSSAVADIVPILDSGLDASSFTSHPLLHPPFVPEGCRLKPVYFRGAGLIAFYDYDTESVVQNYGGTTLPSDYTYSVPGNYYIDTVYYGGTTTHHASAFDVVDKNGAVLQTLSYPDATTGNYMRGMSMFDFHDGTNKSRSLVFRSGESFDGNNWIFIVVCPKSLENHAPSGPWQDFIDSLTFPDESGVNKEMYDAHPSVLPPIVPDGCRLKPMYWRAASGLISRWNYDETIVETVNADPLAATLTYVLPSHTRFKSLWYSGLGAHAMTFDVRNGAGPQSQILETLTYNATRNGTRFQATSFYDFSNKRAAVVRINSGSILGYNSVLMGVVCPDEGYRLPPIQGDGSSSSSFSSSVSSGTGSSSSSLSSSSESSISSSSESSVSSSSESSSSWSSESSVSRIPYCNGVLATIYVVDGVIVGGPMSGNTYFGNVFGTNGDDVIVGTSENDHVYALEGNDLVCGRDGNDLLHGGENDDTLYGENGKDWLVGDAGNDMIVGGLDDDDLQGGSDNDTLMGLQGNDLLDGDLGNDTLYGGSGNDVLVGGIGGDNLCGEGDEDVLSGGFGEDRLSGGPASDIVNGGFQNDICINGDAMLSCEDTSSPVPACDTDSEGGTPSSSSSSSSSSDSSGSSSSSSSSSFVSVDNGGEDGGEGGDDGAQPVVFRLTDIPGDESGEKNSNHRGHQTNVIGAALQFTINALNGDDNGPGFDGPVETMDALAPGGFGGSEDDTIVLSTDEIAVICRARNLISQHESRQEAALTTWAASVLSRMLGRSVTEMQSALFTVECSS